MSMNAKAETKQKGSLFEMEGTPGIGEVLPWHSSTLWP